MLDIFCKESAFLFFSTFLIFSIKTFMNSSWLHIMWFSYWWELCYSCYLSRLQSHTDSRHPHAIHIWPHLKHQLCIDFLIFLFAMCLIFFSLIFITLWKYLKGSKYCLDWQCTCKCRSDFNYFFYECVIYKCYWLILFK